MQVVHFTEKLIGSFDWELPQDLAGVISSLPEEAQIVLMRHIENQMKSHAHLIIGAMKMGPMAEAALDLINDSQLLLTRELLRACRQ
jgi:hypothetical protein